MPTLCTCFFKTLLLNSQHLTTLFKETFPVTTVVDYCSRAFHKWMDDKGYVMPPHIVHYGDIEAKQYHLAHRRVKEAISVSYLP